MIRRIILLLFLLQSIINIAGAQQLPDDGLSQIRITDTGKTIRAHIQIIGDQPKPQAALDYYWYASGRIHRQQGGFSGHLLHGSYEEYYLNRSLKIQGNYDHGLKDGLWKSWNDNGRLTEEITWRRGEKEGSFTEYNTRGLVSRSGQLQHGELEGKILSNPGTDSAKVTRYHHGHITPVKQRTLLQKINIFKRKKAGPPAT